MSNSVKVLYRGVYRNDQLFSILIINITLVISVQLSSYPLQYPPRYLYPGYIYLPISVLFNPPIFIQNK